MSKVLVVDDEQAICWGLSRLGRSMGHVVVTASTAEDAVQAAAREQFDAVVLDVRLPGMSGLEAMSRLRQHTGAAPIIIMTAHGDLATAVEAVRKEAFEYLPKPFDLDQMRQVLSRALAPAPKANESPRAFDLEGLIGRSPVMQEAFKQIALAAASDVSALLLGEIGTGKELAARSIHRFSSRAKMPFVVANLAGLSAAQADVELFGQARDADTDASADRTGLLRVAHGGTLLIDELTDLPLSTQAKLLRALDHNEFAPIGSSVAVPFDVRVLAATSRDLLHEIEAGRFRHDLYFHLNTMNVTLPPLRDRGEDIVDLARSFAQAGGTGSVATIDSSTVAELRRRPWHGNVRELRSAIERAIAAARSGPILPEHLPPPIPANLVQPVTEVSLESALPTAVRRWADQRLRESSATGNLYDELLKQIEPAFLQAVLEKHHGHLTAAAETLGLHRHTLRKKLTQHGLDSDAT